MDLFDENSPYKGTVFWDLIVGDNLTANVKAQKATKQQIKDIIYQKIFEDKSNLEDVKNYIENRFQKSLISYEISYIEQKYIKFCSEFWLKEIPNAFKELTDDKTKLIEILNTLENIQNVKDVPNQFQNLKYYTLLVKHYKLVSKEYEIFLLNQFKKECFKQIIIFSDSVEKEVKFLENFVNFLKTFKSLKSITRELKLEDFHNNKITFDEFLDNIINIDKNIACDKNIILLQELAKCLQEAECIFVIDKLKKIIDEYIKPIGIAERNLDNRLVVEVTGKNIVISEILDKLEFLCDNSENKSKIEEVRFVDADIIHIDADLKKDIWHGKNIVIFSDTIKIDDKRTWDISGKDGDNYVKDAGTGEDGCGKDGLDGYAGESGGNVLIFVKEMVNPINFTIISHGGNGGNGQNGGKGKDGVNGKGIEPEQFYEKFPPPCDFIEFLRPSKVSSNLKNIDKESSTKTCWVRAVRSAGVFVDSYNGDTLPSADYMIRRVYMNALTNQGNEITFSFENGGFITFCQAYLIYKGTSGRPGSPGGEYGFGGEGGYSGDILVENPYNRQKVFPIIKITENGKEGAKGEEGKFGKHGKNGWDMGYMDYSSSSAWPKYFGTDKCSKLTLNFYRTSSENRVMCPYREYKGKDDIYVEIKAASITKINATNNRNSTKHNKKRQQHAQATRKKNILQKSILDSYSHNFNMKEIITLQNLQSDVHNIKQRALEAITENQKQQVHPNICSEIKYHSNFTFNKQFELYDFSIDDTTVKEDKKQISMMKKKKKKKKKKKNEKKNKNLSNDKLRFAELEKIATQLPPYQEIPYNKHLTFESIARDLFKIENNFSSISHHYLGTFGQYFSKTAHEQYNEIFRFCNEELKKNNENCDILKESFIMFVLEAGKSADDHLHIDKYYKEYIKFNKERDYYFEIFQSELSRPRHEKVFKSIAELKTNSDQYEKVLGDKFLIFLFKRLIEKLNLKYDWNVCYKDETSFKEYMEYIKKKGPLSASYRELLALAFNININVYVEEESNKLFLLNRHNPSSKQVIYILFKNDEFMELNFHENYFKLQENRKIRNGLYAKILTKFEGFKNKRGFYDYLMEKDLLYDNNVLEWKYDGNWKNESDYIKQIIQYFPEVIKQDLKERLEKITSQYIGSHGILYYIMKRFYCEGKIVHYQELYYLINSIVASVVEDRKELNIFFWIVAAYPQNCWMVEMTLLQLENLYRKPLENKCELRDILSRITNKNVLVLFNMKLNKCQSISSISSQCIENILYLLCNIPNETLNLEKLELSEWLFALREKYWTYKLSQLVCWKENNELFSTASYYILFLGNIFGTDLVETFLRTLENKKQELSPDILTKILCNFYNERWNLSEAELEALDKFNINEWIITMDQKFIVDKDRDITQLIEIIKSNRNTSERISNNLSRMGNTIRSNYDKYEMAKDQLTEIELKNQVKDFIKLKKKLFNEKENIEEAIKEILTLMDKIIHKKRSFILRDTQKLTILALLTNDKNTLAQVSTGEGKSIIVVAAAIIKVLCGQRVHIITSSSVLAKRDAEVNKDIYHLFGINVFHNCFEDINKRKDAYSGNDVIYGDLSSFQRDYLLDKFYGQNILGDHNFENVIVDEVDSMLLDKGNNMLYLSHNLAGFDKLESVYIFIWQWINTLQVHNEEINSTFNTKEIKLAVLKDLYGLIEIKDIGKLDSELKDEQKNIIWERLVRAKILDDQGKLLQKSIDDRELQTILSSEFNIYTDRLSWLLNKCIDRKKCIHIPDFLRPFVEHHLESWINNAVIAFFMQPGQDYVIDVDRTESSSDCNPNIIVIDKDTGTDQTNYQWDEALHQFLQLKHGCKLSLQSLKAVFISNVSFFKLYNNLYGLTGTLGSEEERNLLEEIHEIEFVTIPTAKIKQFYEDIPILCTSKEEWKNKIYDKAITQTKEKTRSVLIICETINDVEYLYKYFKVKRVKGVLTYTRDYEEFDIGQYNQKLDHGIIILATNLAGRGTDLRITENLRKAGGLHVCLTYLPNNVRIEQQAFGRAARNGDKGSGQLIIMDPQKKGYCHMKIFDLKKQRNNQELHRLSNIKLNYETKIIAEENCFRKFKEEFQQLDHMLSIAFNLQLKENETEIPLQKYLNKWTHMLLSTLLFKDRIELKEILLQSCLDKWALWLDKQKYINGLDNSLNELLLQLKDLKCNNIEDLVNWFGENTFQMIKLAKYLSKIEKYKEAIIIFDKVIKQEKYFSEAAHYYKAIALARMIKWKKPLKNRDKELSKLFKTELRETVRLLDQHISFSMSDASIISQIKKDYNQSIIQIDGYEEQKKNLCNIYSLYQQSVYDILGYPVTPESFINNDINHELAENLYDSFIEKGILKNMSVKKKFSEEELNSISFSFGVSGKQLKKLLYANSGKEFFGEIFQKELKNDIKLPNREDYWKSLIKHKILNEEVNYIIVDNDKMRKIDPKLLNSLQKLNKQTLELNNEVVFLYPERIEQQKNNDIFKKSDFINTASINKYQKLKRLKVFSFNKKAHIDQSKINNITFSDYDSFTLEDFTNINITNSDSGKVLEELVQKEILKRDENDPNIFRLQIEFDEFEQVLLPSFPVYENAVRRLLQHCFTYRIAFQRFVKCITKKNVAELENYEHFQIPLMTKPHKMLFLKLFEKMIIKPVRFKKNTEDLKNEIDNIILSYILPDDLLEFCSKNLIENLIKEISTVENIPQLIKILLKYYNVQNLIEDIEKITTIAKILLFQWGIISRSIISALEQARGSLIALNIPDIKLKPLGVFFDGQFGNIDEIRIFFLNGLYDILQPEESKYTGKMIFNTAVVVAMGMCQLAVGAAIQLCTMGVLTHVGGGLFNEGMSDIQYACSAVCSGYFSWKDYRQYKFYSLVFSLITAGVGMYYSSGCERSTFGEILSGPDYKYNNVAVQKTCGSQLIEAAGGSYVAKEFKKHIATKFLEGMVFGLANAAIDKLIENYLQGLFRKITYDILSKIEDTLKIHSVSNVLKDAYIKLGREQAREIVNTLTNTILIKLRYMEEFLSNLNKIISYVVQGLSEAYTKRNIQNNIILRISQILGCSEYILKLSNIGYQVFSFLNSLEEEINKKILDNNIEKSFESQITNDNKLKDCEKFIADVIHQWKELLCEKISPIFTHIASSIIKDGVKYLGKHIGKYLQELYQENQEFQVLEKRKKEYHAELLEKHINKKQKKNGKKNCITEKYHADLLKLLMKTRSSKLFAALVREGIPMDFTCVGPFAKIIHRQLEQKGVNPPGVVIQVIGDNGIKQKFYSDSEGEIGRVIVLRLKDNHFTFFENNTLEKNDNNCLYYAAVDVIPELRNITPKNFRDSIANFIENDKKIQDHISRGWHRIPLYHGAYGGRKLIKISADELREQLYSGENRFTQSSVSDETSDKYEGGIKMHLSTLTENMNKDGWKGDPINAVRVGNKLIFLDNRRPIAASSSNLKEVHIMEYSENEILPVELAKRYGKPKAIDALKKRMRSGSFDLDVCNRYPEGFPLTLVRIRTKNHFKQNKQTKSFLGNLSEAGFQIGPRTVSFPDIFSAPDYIRLYKQ